MRLAATAKHDEYNVWLTDDELDQVCRVATTARDDLICQLGGYVGLQAFEIPQITPNQVRRTDDGEYHRLRVPSGKDTTGNGGKPRDAYLPAHVERELHRYQTREKLDETEPLVDLFERRVRAIVNECAHRAAEQTGDDDVRYVIPTISVVGSPNACWSITQ